MLFKENSKKTNYFILYICFLLPLLLINLPVVMQMKMLRMGSDEYNILSIAAYFAGVDWSSYNESINAYHGFGGAIIYIPLFWIFKDALIIYKIALVENILLLTIIPLIAFYIMTHYFEIKNKVAFFVSLCITLYPYYLVSNKHTWSENAVVIFTWLNLLMMLKTIEKRNSKYAFLWQVLYIFVAGYSYMVHGRCIIYVVVAPIIVFLTYLQSNVKKNKVKEIVIKGSVLLFFLGGLYLSNSGVISFLKDYLWKADELRNTMGTLAEDRLAYFTDIQNIKNMFKMMFGQFFYMYVATMGMAFFSFVLFGSDILGCARKKEITEDKRYYFCTSIYIFLTYAGSLAISILGLISGVTVGSQRKDYVIWGRHTEPLFPILILFVVIYCLNDKITQKYIRIWFVSIFGVIVGFLRWAFPLMVSMPNNGHSSIVSILVWVRWEFFSFTTEEAFFRIMDVIIWVMIIASLMVLFLKKKKVYLFLIVLTIQSLLSYAYVSDAVTLKIADATYGRIVGVQEFVNENDMKWDKVFYLSNDKRYPSEMQIIFNGSDFSLLYDPMNPADVDWGKLDTNNSCLIIDTGYFEQLRSEGYFSSEVFDEASYVNLDGNKTIVVFGEEFIEIDNDVWDIQMIN